MMKQKKPIYFVLCLLAGVCTLSGCIEEYEADIPDEESHLLVVEGTICSSQLNVFYLSRTQGLNTTYASGREWGAKVSVRGSDGTEFNAQQHYDWGIESYYGNDLGHMPMVTNGGYTCWIDTLYPDVEYYLHIEVDGDVYESVPQKPLPTEKLVEVRGVQNTPESNINVLVTPEAPINPERTNYYSWTFDETWEVHSDYTTTLFFDIATMKCIHKLNQFPERGWKDGFSKTIMVGASHNYEGQHIKGFKIYDIDRSNERMFHKYSGLVHQRAITKAEYEYELARRQAGTEMGGLFTPQPSALPSNIHCLTSPNKRVIGFVGCSMNTSERRFFLHAKDFSIYRPPRRDTRWWLEDCTLEDCKNMVEKGMFLCEWLDERMSPGGQLRTAWAFKYQLDVRSKGAYIEEPEFWNMEEREGHEDK